jgi:ferrous iron transport protein B
MFSEGDTAASDADVHQAADDTRLQRTLRRSVSPAGALAYMVFILLYFPCVATFIAIRQESGGWKWAILTAIYTIFIAWTAAFITFRIASIFLT